MGCDGVTAARKIVDRLRDGNVEGAA